MAATYSGNPSASDKDEVRFLIGDVDTDNALFTDEEIDWLISEEGSPLAAAARACEILATRFAREADTAVGDLRVDLSKLSEQYAARAKALRRRLLVGTAKPQVRSEREAMFRVDQFTFNGGRSLDRTEKGA